MNMQIINKTYNTHSLIIRIYDNISNIMQNRFYVQIIIIEEIYLNKLYNS